jgi:hypothetical protein
MIHIEGMIRGLKGPIIIKNVYVGEQLEDLLGTNCADIRITEKAYDEDYPVPYQYLLELQTKCGHCGKPNWILVGTDPGEYRCEDCVEWL